MEIEMIERPETALTVQDRAALALNASKTEADLKALALKNMHIVAVIDKPGRDQAHGAAMELKRARVDIEKVSKDARDDATKFSKAVIAEEKRLIGIIEPEEARLVSLRDAWDDEQARIKAEAEAKERARITAIHARINSMREFTALAGQCRTADRISSLTPRLNEVYKFDFEEFMDEATAVYQSTYDRIQAMWHEKHEAELEAARMKAEQEAAAAQLAADRAALERERAELAAARKAIEDAKPKAEPVDAYEQELQAFAAVVTPHPVSSIGAASEPEKAVLPLTPAKATRPTDMAIVEVLTNHYRVHESKVLEWLLAMDLDAVNEAIAAEFL